MDNARIEIEVERRILERLCSIGDVPATIEGIQGEFVGHEAVVRRVWDRLHDSGADETASERGRFRGPEFGLLHEGRFGRYRLLREIGKGGQGRVFLAEDERLGRTVALKILNAFLSPDARRRFEREAEITSSLQHPGICPVYDIGENGGIPFLSMPYIEGVSLAAELQNGRLATWTPPKVFEFFEQAARAVEAAHASGVVHRDLKPANLIVGDRGRCVILDFGMAARLDDQERITRTGDLLGTPSYMAPEQLTSPEDVDHRTDVWALGVALYECVTGCRPFQGPTFEATQRAILRDEPKGPRLLQPSLPTDVTPVLATALDKDRDRRYSTAQEFAEDLRRLRMGEPVRATSPSPVRRAAFWIRRNPAASLMAAMLLVAMVAVGAALWIGVDRIRERRIDRAERELALIVGSLIPHVFDDDPLRGDGPVSLPLTDAAVRLREVLEALPESEFARAAASFVRDRSSGQGAARSPEAASPTVSALHEALHLAQGWRSQRASASELVLRTTSRSGHDRRAYAVCLALLAESPEEGDQAVERLRIVWGGESPWRYFAGRALHSTRPRVAEDHYRAALAVVEDPWVRFEALYYLASLVVGDAERGDEAGALARRALEHAPTGRRGDALTLLGRMHTSESRERSVEYLEEAGALGSASAWFVRSMQCAAEGDLEQEEVYLRRVLDVDPDHDGANVNLAALLVNRAARNGEPADFEEIQRLIEAADNPRGWSLYGHWCTLREEYSEARSALDRALELDPPNMEARINLCSLADQMKDASMLLDAAHDLVSRYPDASSGHHWLGIGESKLARQSAGATQHYEEELAIRHFERACELAPPNEDFSVQYDRAVALLLSAGRWNQLLADLQRAKPWFEASRDDRMQTVEQLAGDLRDQFPERLAVDNLWAFYLKEAGLTDEAVAVVEEALSKHEAGLLAASPYHREENETVAKDMRALLQELMSE